MEQSTTLVRLASELRAIEADSPYDGEFYLHGICATAARLVSECNAIGVLRISTGNLQPNPNAFLKTPIGSPEPWYDVWLAICRILEDSYKTQLPNNLTVSRVTFHKQGPLTFTDLKEMKGVGLYFKSLTFNGQTIESLEDDGAITCTERSPRDWKQRARNFAAVCEFLAELACNPATPTEQCDKWLIDEWERGVLTIKELRSALYDKPQDWQGDVSTDEGMRSRIAAAYRRAGKEQPKRKNGRPANS